MLNPFVAGCNYQHDLAQDPKRNINKNELRRNDPVLHEELTNRENEILMLISEGKSNQEIADELFITLKTVKTHVSNILAKLEVEDRTQAAIYAFKHGLVK